MPPGHLSLRYYDAAFQLTLPSSCRKASTFRRPRSLSHSRSHSASAHPSSQHRSTTFATEPNIDVKSLRNTLDAHRESNRASVIRKTIGQGESRRLQLPPELGLPAVPITTPTRFKKVPTFKRIRLPSQPLEKVSRGTHRGLTALWQLNQGAKPLSTRHRLPWLRHLDSPPSNAWASAVDRLSSEIRAFEKYASPSEEEQRAADNALKDVVDFIKCADDNFEVAVIGSRATDTADPLSDLDFNVSNRDQADSSPISVLNKIHHVFTKRRRKFPSQVDRLEFVCYLKHARVPILIFRHRASALPIQIQCTPRTYDRTEYVKTYLKEHPSLRSLFKVLKQLLQMRGLTLGSSGGITSYPLLNMIVAALKLSEGKYHPADVGNQLLFLLNMYSEIDFSTEGISIRPSQIFSKKEAIDWKPPFNSSEDSAFVVETFERELAGRRMMCLVLEKELLMTLQDPANPRNDLGASVFRIQDVQETFISVRAKLKQVMAQWEDYSPTQGTFLQHQSRPPSLLEPCIGGDYRFYEQERNDLRDLSVLP